MKVSLDPSAWKELKWHEYAVRFLFGGIITALTGLLAHRYGPIVAGLFLAFPAIFPASVTLVESHEREKLHATSAMATVRARSMAAVDAAGTASGTLGLVAFGVVIWELLPAHPAWLVLSGAAVVWVAVAVTAWLVQQHV